MSDNFADYIEAQINVMRCDIGKEDSGDLDMDEDKIMEWIEKNAPAFRANWEKKQYRKLMKNVVE